MTKTRKTILTFLLGLAMSIALCFGVVFSFSKPVNTTTAQAATYTTKDVAMMGRVAGWYGNGNGELRLTLGECDWAAESGQKSYGGSLAGMLDGLGFFDHIKLGDKTLREWGCTSCYDNIYWLNSGEPKYTLMIPIAMGSANMSAASAAGIGANTPITILEGALIPSYAYLQGDTSATVYRAGCDYVTMNAGVDYGIAVVGKTEVQSLQYTTGWDSTYNNAYLGVSLKGDDFAGNGAQTERATDYNNDVYMAKHYSKTITADGVAGKAEGYGLFNLGSKGQGYYSFVWRVQAENCQSITIPAGTMFPSFAMSALKTANGHFVYMMYETQTDVTFYKQPDGSWQKPMVEKETSVTSVKVSGTDADNFTVFSLSAHDYPTSADNYGGTAISTKTLLAQGNFYSHVLINGVAIGSTNEAYVNVWGNKGAFAIRTTAGLNATKITVLAGCQFPAYSALANGERETYVTTEDVTFVKNANGDWEVYVPEGDFDTKVTQVQFGRSTNVLNINLSDNDYPAPNGNDASTYNIGVTGEAKERVLALNLFDNIIIDGYTLRSRYESNSTAVSDPWIWINRFVGHNFAVRVANAGGAAMQPNKIIIRAGTQFPSKAYIDKGTQLFYVTTEETTYIRVSDSVEAVWDRQAKITFMADGNTVATRTYTKTNGIDGAIPEVPEKVGHKAVWEAYTLNGEDIVVNAVYTEHGFNETKTNISKMEFAEGFLILYLTNNDYPANEGTLAVADKVSSLHFFDYIEMDGRMAASAPVGIDGAFLSVWNKWGSFASYLPGHYTPTQSIVIKKGCQIPSNAYRLDGNNKSCFVVEQDVTFLNENGTWVRQSNGDTEENFSKKPTYEKEYVLSDLYQTGYPTSAELKKGYLVVGQSTSTTVAGHNTSESFSLTFDLSLELGDKDVSAFGDSNPIFDVSMATVTGGYNSGHGFGWSLYLYRSGNPNKCVELHYQGGIKAYEEVGIFDKGKTYRVTLGYKLLDKATGTVEIYTAIDDFENLETFVLGADYNSFAANTSEIVFTNRSALDNSIRISDPGLQVGEKNHTITLSNGTQAIVSESANKFTLPELNAYEYGNVNDVFVGWTTNVNTLETLYPAGYTMNLSGDVTLYPVWMQFAMRDGAAVRTYGESGLRFLVDVNSAAYQLGLNKGLIVGTGTLVVPTSYLDSGAAFVHETFPEGYYMDIPTNSWSSQSGALWTYAAALVKISPAQYTRTMSARGYLKVAYSDGSQGYVYTAYDKNLHARSIYEVATSAFHNNEKPQAVLDYVNSVADIVINNEFEVSKNENSAGDYTVSSNNDETSFTVTLNKNVKALIINGQRITAGYTSEIILDNSSYTVSGYKLSTNGLTFTFTLADGDTYAYYNAIIDYYRNSNDYTDLHKQRILTILDEEWCGDLEDCGANADYVAQLQSVKTESELSNNIGETQLATPVVRNGLGYTVTWDAVENADYYFVTDDNDYRDGVYVMANDELVYKTEVVGKHNVTVTAYSYYDTYKTSQASASFATVEVKPVFSYKAMYDGLYKFSADDMVNMGLVSSKSELNDKDDGTSFGYDDDEKLYFAYYNKDTGWSKNQGYATDWTSPKEFPAHAARLKAMGNNILLLSENTAASFKANDVWETSRTKYIMDTAWSLGMKVIVCDDALYKLSKEVGSQNAAASAIAARQGFADYVTHPAFYGFSLEDEPEKGDEVKSVGYMVKALKAACANLGYSKANGNEPFFLACLYQKNIGFSTIWNYDDYLQSWVDETGLDYLYVDLYTGHAMGDSTNRYTTTYDAIYSNSLGVMSGDVKFHQVITAHTQNKGTEGKLTEQDMYMSMLYAAAHNVAGYSWFCYFPIVSETAGSMVGFDGNGYGNGIENSATYGYSYYNAAKTAGYQFELIQGVLNGYKLQSRSHSSNLLTTTLTKAGAGNITMYVNADVQNMSANKTVTASGSVCYLVGHGVGTAEAPYQVVSGSVTLKPGQAVICVA